MRTALLASFLLGATALPAQDREFGVAVPTTLTQMRSEPAAYKSVKVQFTVQFASLGRIANPFFTKFTPSDFANFYGWADEQPIWQQSAYDDVFGMLFLSKSHPKLDQLYSLKLYQRIRITGVVRNTFQGAPWIEVVDFEGVEGQLDTALLTHLYRGERHMEQRQWQRAMAELAMVQGKNVPPPALRAAHKSLGLCLLRQGEAPLAISYLKSAEAMSTARDTELDTMLAVAQAQPEQAIDRTVDARSLKDSERPMWEAFDGDRTVRPSKSMR